MAERLAWQGTRQLSYGARCNKHIESAQFCAYFTYMSAAVA